VPDVLAYLQSKNIATKNATSKNVHTACFFCQEDPAARGRLYINVDPDADVPGLYTCFKCGEKGNFTTLKRHFGDPVGEREVDSHVRYEILKTAAAYYHETLQRFPSVAAYLKGPERGLTAGTISQHEIGYAPMAISYDVGTRETTITRPRHLFAHLVRSFTPKEILATGLCQETSGKIFDSLHGMVTLPYHVAGNVVAIRGRSWPYTPADFETWETDPYEPPKAKYKTPGGTSTRLYNTDAVWGQKEIHVTEGEFDALVLEQAGYPAVGVPGAQAWQDEWDDYLHPLRRVWLVFDRDPAGERGATKLLERFGSKVRRVFLSAEGVKCDPTTWFQTHSESEYAELLAEASKGGLLVTVHDAIDEFRNVQSKPGLRFGWGELDHLLAPGVQPSQVMIFLARTNAGKTLLLLNLMHQIRTVPGQDDKHMLFLSLEQTRGEWWDRARRIHRFHNLRDTESHAERFWANHIRLVDRNQIRLAELRQILDDYDYEVGGLPDLICLDYLGYWARAFKGEAYERMSAAIHAIKQIAKDYRIPFVIPQQVGRSVKDGEEIAPDSARDAGTIEETADFLIAMWRPDEAMGRTQAEKDGVIKFKILKSRHGGKGAEFAMQWSPVSLVMVPYVSDFDPLVKRARAECKWHRDYTRKTWEEIMMLHDGEGIR
jgi:DnaB-like helicase C terminal domain/Toprim-like